MPYIHRIIKAGRTKKHLRGTVEYIHPRGNFHTVAFEVRGKIIKESIQGVAVRTKEQKRSL